MIANVDAARALRARCPWIPMHEAVAWTRVGAALDPKRSCGLGGFFGSSYSRYDICFAHAWHATLWGPNDSGRVWRDPIRVRLGYGSSLESEDEAVKEIYGKIVKREHSLIVGWDRLKRRYEKAGRIGVPSWPGTNNMPRGTWAWIESQGFLAAVLAYVA